MLSKHDSIQRDQLEMITLDQLVPPNHLVRKMEAVTSRNSGCKAVNSSAATVFRAVWQ
ncbi:hypothetical protein RCO48_18570 [Peribacillus frigoritolerans]|nr:hypothetical protein [Peribacillus frigoritolerans]